MSKSATDINELFRILDKAVFIPMPLGTKGPKEKGWNQVTWEEAQTVTYKRKIMDAVERGGNIGILLGPESGDLVAIDLDDDEDAERFFKLLPWARDTMVTRGRHFQVWFYMTHDGYPARRMVLKESSPGKPTVEFRGGGGIQSVVFGPHPDDVNIRYSWNGKIPKHIDYVDLQLWLATLSGQKSLEKEHPGQNLDREWLRQRAGIDIHWLDLVKLLQDNKVKLTYIGKDQGADKWAMPCPWKYNHTTGNSEKDAAIIQHPPGKFFPAFKCFHAHCSELGLPDLLDLLEVGKDELRKYCVPSRDVRKKLTEYVVIHQRVFEEPKLPRQLIEGLLYEKTKMMLSGPPKTRKSWMAADIGLSLCLGEPWLGFDTCQSRVLYLNMEIPGPFLDWRLYMMEMARKIRTIPEDSFTILNLRGADNMHVEEWTELADFCRRYGPYGLIIIDPIYKVFGGKDENSASDMAALLRNVDMISEVSGASILEVHHFPKGRYDEKDVGDRAAGSGVFYRDPDLFATIGWANKEKVENESRLDFRTRLMPILHPIGMKWAEFQWHKDDSIVLSENKKEEEKAQPKHENTILDILKNYPKGLANAQLKLLAAQRNVPLGSFDRALKKLKDTHRAIKVGEFYKLPSPSPSEI